MKDAKSEQRGDFEEKVRRNSFFTETKKSLTLFRSIFALSLQNLRANKLRTFLTLLGIIVGVAAVISVVTIIEGLNKSVASTFSANGSTVFTLSKNPSVITSREEMIKMNKRKDITREDADAVVRLCRSCWRIGWWTRGSETVKSAYSSADNVMIRGASGAIFEIEDLQVETGRNWTENEENSGQYVAVVGTDIVKNLFNSAAPEAVIGQEIRVHGGVFRIIGVAASQGTIFGVSRDNFVITPYQTARKILPSRDSLIVDIQVANSADLESAKDEVTTIMRSRRGKISLTVGEVTEEDEGFAVESSEVFLSLYKDATDNIYLVTIGVSAISLIVGGIVVMNIMLVSVVERTKEIGLRKAVGARRRDILEQFLSEAVVIASIGGLIGVFAGFALAYLISYLVGFPASVSYWSVIMGVGVSSLVGIVSGIYPAWKAAALNPVDAMRKE
ncbi:MAG TPA: ABC transporter permease [Pyrinomonadaceae bacterium]|nr:ABC transporter permease [Pyrinomonadaceae bacterium]